MEEQLERNKSAPCVVPIHFPKELARKRALEKDLAYYIGKNWEKKVSISPAAQKYVARLEEIGQSNPALLVAHSYTRYLGDLSGGQILSKRARKAFALPEGQGTAFYEFEHIEDPTAFKDVYRERLNAIPLTDKTRGMKQRLN
jgi:heme oxygenase